MRTWLLACLTVVVLAPPAPAQDPADVATDVSNEVMSPFCPGVTLHDCPSPAAVELRRRIEDWARSGMSEARILERLEAEYGPEIRGAPPARGAGLLAWLLPALAVLLGAGVAITLARHWSARPSTATPAPSVGHEDRARLEAELAALREGR
jgi:cytochrome c-type biogenesis protein CcmH